MDASFCDGGVLDPVNTVPPGIVKGGGIYVPHEYVEMESFLSVEHAVDVVDDTSTGVTGPRVLRIRLT